jgi:hypothetical protein
VRRPCKVDICWKDPRWCLMAPPAQKEVPLPPDTLPRAERMINRILDKLTESSDNEAAISTNKTSGQQKPPLLTKPRLTLTVPPMPKHQQRGQNTSLSTQNQFERQNPPKTHELKRLREDVDELQGDIKRLKQEHTRETDRLWDLIAHFTGQRSANWRSVRKNVSRNDEIMCRRYWVMEDTCRTKPYHRYGWNVIWKYQVVEDVMCTLKKTT